VGDEAFLSILENATHVELENFRSLGDDVRYFPDDELGVAQGCSLSSLLGNVFLREFDTICNTKEVTCLRYVDDFLLIGQSEEATNAVFQRALRWLRERGLSAYERGHSKCHAGPSRAAFEFLGCKVQPGLVTPSREGRKRLIAKVKCHIAAGLGLQQTLGKIGNSTAAWASAYRFCNDHYVIGQVEQTVDDLLIDYVKKKIGQMRGLSARERCEMLGIRSMKGIVAEHSRGGVG
jgi:hypothetical protein